MHGEKRKRRQEMGIESVWGGAGPNFQCGQDVLLEKVTYEQRCEGGGELVL